MLKHGRSALALDVQVLVSFSLWVDRLHACMAVQWMVVLVLFQLLFQFGLAASGTGGT